MLGGTYRARGSAQGPMWMRLLVADRVVHVRGFSHKWEGSMCKDQCVWAHEKKNDALPSCASTYSGKRIGCRLANSDHLRRLKLGNVRGKMHGSFH